MKASIHLFFFSLLLTGLTLHAESLNIYLVAAQSGNGPSDPKLQKYENDLRRVLRFDRFDLLTRRTASVETGKTAKVNLSGEHAVRLTPNSDDGRSLVLQIEWQEGNRTILGTKVRLTGNRPAILGGPVRDPGTLIVIIERK